MGNPRRGPRVRGPYERGGRWQIEKLDPLAERPREYRTFETREEAEAARRWYRDQLATVELSAAAALERYQEALRQRGCRPRTIEVAASAVRHMMGESALERPLQDITASTVRQRLAERQAEKTVRGAAPSPTTIATELRQTRSWLRWCAEAGLRALPAGLDRVRLPRRRETAEGKEQLTREEARRFAVEALRRVRGGDEGALAAYALLVLGVRARELLDRRVRDLDGDWLWIRRAKTARGCRRVQVPEPLLGLLRDQVDADDPVEARPTDALILGEEDGAGPARSTSWLEGEVAEVCQAAGVTAVCPHGLRGTHATLAEAAGVSAAAVAASLGHTTPAVTGRHYTLPEARDGARAERLLKVMQGGRR